MWFSLKKNYTKKTELKYTIDTELSPGNLNFLLEYLRRRYLLQHKRYRTFRNVRIITENGISYLSYRVSVPNTDQHVDVTVAAGIPIEVMLKLSDPEEKVLNLYGVWKKKSLYDRTFMGTERTTFLIDEKGIVRKTYRKVRVKGHVWTCLLDLTDEAAGE